MRVAHFSDLHGNWAPIYRTFEKPDLWICSGDLFPNRTRGNLEIEPGYQAAFLAGSMEALKTALADRPLLWCPGNHDFLDFEELAKGQIDIHDVSKQPFNYHDIVFYGAREINYIAGEWAGEVFDHRPTVERFLEHNPHVLITHAPPASILDRGRFSGQGYGVDAYTSYFTYQSHQVSHWFFGHVHEVFPDRVLINETYFYNNACRLNYYTLDF